MRLLLDTHAFLWFVAASNKLSRMARLAIEDQRNDKLVSIVSLWEIAIESSIGKLELDEPFATLIPRELEHNGFDVLGVTTEHVATVATLPYHHHRDPFDRLLVAQAMVEGMAIVTADDAFDLYSPLRVW